MAASIVWGEESPSEGSAESWSTWKTAAGGDAVVNGDADWGKLNLTNSNHYGPVKDTGNSRGKRFVVKRDSFGEGLGTVNIFIRGSTDSFLANAETPSWELYSAPINRVWRYVQIKAEKVSGVWEAPLGIPTPSFPSDLNVARPTLPSPWSSSTAGFYFVQQGGTAGDNGTPAAPRGTLPTPSAGDVVVMGESANWTGTDTINWTGSSGSPIWLMSYTSDGYATITGDFTFSGSYIIVDGLDFSRTDGDETYLTGNHIMLRRCKDRNTYGAGYGEGIDITGDYIVIYNCIVGPHGNWEASTDVDRHGIKLEGGASYVHIVDSTFYHCQGDGVQVGDVTNAASAIQYVYVGRNIGYENLQSCFWTKNATDVIFSENTCYGIDYSNGGNGQAMGGQYDPDYVWFINNIVHDCKGGIHIAGPDNGGGGPWYVIGNLIYNIESDAGSCNNYDVGALMFRNEGGYTAIFNTIYNADMFFADPNGSGTTRVYNNIFSVKDSSSNNCTALDVGATWTHDYNLFSDAAYDPDSETHRQVEAASSTFVSPGSNFRLVAASAAKDNGNPTEEAAFSVFYNRYGININKDLDGIVRPQSTVWNIGAYET